MTHPLEERDLGLTERTGGRRHSDRQAADLRLSAGADLATITGRENLVQAILNRLLTRRGELAGLGHPRYGSRLYELVGEPHDVRTRGRAEIYLRECLAQEPRIAEIVAVEIVPAARSGLGALVISFTVRPTGEDEPLTLQLDLPSGD